MSLFKRKYADMIEAMSYELTFLDTRTHKESVFERYESMRKEGVFITIDMVRKPVDESVKKSGRSRGMPVPSVVTRYKKRKKKPKQLSLLDINNDLFGQKDN